MTSYPTTILITWQNHISITANTTANVFRNALNYAFDGAPTSACSNVPLTPPRRASCRSGDLGLDPAPELLGATSPSQTSKRSSSTTNRELLDDAIVVSNPP